MTWAVLIRRHEMKKVLQDTFEIEDYAVAFHFHDFQAW